MASDYSTMPVLQRWLATFEAKNTITQYRCALKRFFRLVYQEGTLEELADRYMQDRATDLALVAQDVDSYFFALKDNPPKTQSSYLAGIHSFLVDNRIELGDAFWRKFSRRRKGRARALTKDYMPTNEDLRRLFAHMPVQGKALFTMISSMGTRISETLFLRLSDIDLDSLPARAELRAETTKTQRARVVFFSQEAAEALTEWLKVRSQWMQSNAVRMQHRFHVDVNDERIFPFTVPNAHAIWDLALRKTGLEERDDRTRRRTLHPHCLRKRFRTLLGAENADLTEVLMGHETALEGAYRRPSVEMLAEFYSKAEPILVLSADRASVAELRTRAVEGQREIDEIKRQLAELKAQLALSILKYES